MSALITTLEPRTHDRLGVILPHDPRGRSSVVSGAERSGASVMGGPGES